MFNKPNHCLGVGVNFRHEISDNIVANMGKFDFIEVNTERFFVNRPHAQLRQIVNHLPIVLHGLTMSIGNPGRELTEGYLANLKAVAEKIDCVWFSEHIAITNVGEAPLRSLMPVEFTEKSVVEIGEKVKKIKQIINRPFLLENITYYYAMPTNTLSEVDFYTAVVEQSDCGILLDLNNLYVNAINHQYDPYQFITSLPLERVVEVHLAGCDYLHGTLVDTHASAIRGEVLALFEYVCRKTSINGVVIERDDRLKEFSDLLSEVARVREIFNRYQ